MVKLTKPVFGVVAGEVYPREIAAGEDCPPELFDVAMEQDALEDETGAPSFKTKAVTAPENKTDA